MHPAEWSLGRCYSGVAGPPEQHTRWLSDMVVGTAACCSPGLTGAACFSFMNGCSSSNPLPGRSSTPALQSAASRCSCPLPSCWTARTTHSLNNQQACQACQEEALLGT